MPSATAVLIEIATAATPVVHGIETEKHCKKENANCNGKRITIAQITLWAVGRLLVLLTRTTIEVVVAGIMGLREAGGEGGEGVGEGEGQRQGGEGGEVRKWVEEEGEEEDKLLDCKKSSFFCLSE